MYTSKVFQSIRLSTSRLSTSRLSTSRLSTSVCSALTWRRVCVIEWAVCKPKLEPWQGRKLCCQAGFEFFDHTTSERGQAFAARHAEAILVGRETPDEMKRFYDAFKARMRTYERAPEDCKIFFLAKPIIADTDEAAQQRADALYATAPVEAGLAALSTLMQLDLSSY